MQTGIRFYASARLLATVLFGGAACTAAVGVLIACSKSELPRKIFEDVTPASGLGEYVGMTHGAAWGDFDGDGLPDLYITNHLNKAQLFRNLGNGHFLDVTQDLFRTGRPRR